MPENIKESLKEEQRRLARLEKSIEATRKKLDNVQRQEKATVQKLNLYRRQNEELNSYIVLLQREQARVYDSLETTEQTLHYLEQQLGALQKEYAELVRAIHKTGRTSDEEMLVSSNARGQEQRHAKYMQNITALAGRKADEITQLKDSIACQKLTMEILLGRNNELIEKENQRLVQLTDVINKREKTLEQIRSNAGALKKQIVEKTQSAQKLKNIVALLVEKERKRRAEEEARRKKQGGGFTGDAVARRTSPGSFKQRALPWPISSKSVSSKFGKQKNPGTGIETENLGIGIRADRGTSVQAVAAGTVSLVHWLPGYGSLVIVDHGNGYRTVYANLSSVHVSEGQRINTGSLIGKTGKSVDGEYLHFEVWHNRDALDPLAFLQ